MPTAHAKIRTAILLFSLLSVPGIAWGGVLLRWSSSALPPANELGIDSLVIAWNDRSSTMATQARKLGYHIYVEATLEEAERAAEKADQDGVAGIILNVEKSEPAKVLKDLARLQTAHPKLSFLVLNSEGKRPQMRGSLVIKRDSVFEVSSPTAQPWIDTNLSLIKIQHRVYPGQNVLYTFSWRGSDSEQQQGRLSADDYSIAVAEAGAFHADVVLEIDELFQKALVEHDPNAWSRWKQVQSYATFYSDTSKDSLRAGANVAVVEDVFDTGDEVLNLLARHNIPFSVLQPSDLKTQDLTAYDVVIVFAKSSPETSERIADLATGGKTIVLVEPQGSYPWHNAKSVRVNEHTVLYTVGTGKVLELSEPVTDPEIFAQDIRRLIGKERSLINLWNGLTTIAVPYLGSNGDVALIEFINYAGDPLRVQVQVKGSFPAVLYESPEHKCCESLVPVNHNGFTEFEIPELRIAGRVYLKTPQTNDVR
jgi:protein-tyrosine-phosphatase